MTIDNQPADAAARQRALDTTQSFIVQAPAGSGKTELLIRRILCLLLTVEQPEQILAITFTRKAAAEMRERIRRALEQVALSNSDATDEDKDSEDLSAYELEGREIAQKVLQRDIELGWGLLHNSQRLKLLTIDAFCASLTRSLPVTSTLGAPPSAEENVNDLYEGAALRTLNAGLEDSDDFGEAVSRLLGEFDNNLSRLVGQLASMLAKRDQWLRLVGSEIKREELEAAIGHVVAEKLQVLSDLMPVSIDARVIELAGIGATALRGLNNGVSPEADKLDQLHALPGVSMSDIPAWVALRNLLLTNSGTLRKSVTKTSGFPTTPKDAKTLGTSVDELKQSKQMMVDLLAEIDSDDFCLALHKVIFLPGEGYSDTQWQVLQDLFYVLRYAIADLRIEFASELRCDFTEIAICANEALGNDGAPTDLALELDYRLQHVLVDEFQDTSTSQFALFGKLVEGWQVGDGRTFFAVGDPMQSIYRFRDAEVALFEEAKRNGINTVALETLQLGVNFRSTSTTVNWCNSVFTEIFPTTAARDSGAVTFSPSLAFGKVGSSDSNSDNKNPARDTEVCWHLAEVDAQAQEITRVSADLLKRYPGETLAILVRTRSNLNDMFHCLRRAEIPCRAVELESLQGRPVVADLRSLAWALLFPHDRIAWLSLMRAPWCGLTLAELSVISSLDANKTFWSVLIAAIRNGSMEGPIDISADSRERLARFLDVMEPAVNRARRDRVVEWVESCWLQLGGPAVCNDESDIQAAELTISTLADMQHNGDLWHRDRVMARLGSLFAPSAIPDCDHIQIMTIHKSKGLEFDSVLMPYTERKSRGETSELLNWFESIDDSGETRCLLAPLDTREDKAEKNKKTDGKDRLTTLIRQFHSERAANETLRLLYVATTRARSRLHLFASPKINKDDELDGDKGSLFKCLLPAVKNELPSMPLVDEGVDSSSKAIMQSMEALASDHDHEAIAARERLERLPLSWQMPESLEPFVWPDTSAPDSTVIEPDSVEEQLEFLWAGVDAGAIGTVVHSQLQMLCMHGRDFWQNDGADDRHLHLGQQLQSMGLAGTRLDKAITRVEKAIEQCLGDETGRWLLDNSHQDSYTEHAMTGWIDGEFRNIIIDRMFVADGVRWIVDYKTGDHGGGSVEEFLDSEQQRYAAQLERYGRIVAAQLTEPVMLGLYFPLLQGWRHWQAATESA